MDAALFPDRVIRFRGEASPSLPWPANEVSGAEDSDEDEDGEGEDEDGGDAGVMTRIDSIGPAPAGNFVDVLHFILHYTICSMSNSRFFEKSFLSYVCVFNSAS